jgi:hypothetical protein
MAKSNTHNLPKRAKHQNRELLRQIHIVVTTHNAEAVDPEEWDNYGDVEPVQRTRYDLTD